MANSPFRFRFAPSPNGYLHLGHAFSALFTHEMTRRKSGRMLLRIEDIDVGRSRAAFEEAIYEDLAWLGVKWETPVRRQSEHFNDYTAAIARLDAMGLIYPCFASRSEIIQAVTEKGKLQGYDPDGAPLYPGLYRNTPRDVRKARIEAGEPYSLRLYMSEATALAREKSGGAITFRALRDDGGEEASEARPERWGDIVLARKDVPTSYHIAVVTDDALQGITHVTRGLDLLAATDIHRLLQILLDLPEPLYCHHRLILDERGRKLSKSHHARSLRSLRAEGLKAGEIRRMVKLGPDE
jgi:glutamyl-Q tRNA(Asp) synthetase